MWHSSRANTQLAEEPVELDSAWFSQCGHVRWELTSTQAAGWLGNLAHLPGPLQHHFHHLFLPSIVAITCHRPIYATWSRDPYLQLPASNVLALSVMWWHQPFVVNKYFPRVLKHLSSHLCSSLLFNHTLSYILAKTMCTPSGKEPSRLLWSEACLQVANVRVQTPRLAVCTPKDSMQSTSFHFVTVLAHEWIVWISPPDIQEHSLLATGRCFPVYWACLQHISETGSTGSADGCTDCYSHIRQPWSKAGLPTFSWRAERSTHWFQFTFRSSTETVCMEGCHSRFAASAILKLGFMQQQTAPPSWGALVKNTCEMKMQTGRRTKICRR